MLKQRNDQIQTAIRTLDVVICLVAFFAAYWFRNFWLAPKYGEIGTLDSLIWILGVSVVIHLVVYPLYGFYESLRLKSVSDIVIAVVKAAFMELVLLGALIFFVKAKETSRYFFALFLLGNYSLILAEKLGIRFLLSSIRRRGYNYRQVLIAGRGKSAARVIGSLTRNNHWGYVPCGILREEWEAMDSIEVLGVPTLGGLSDLDTILKERAVDEVFFALERFDSAQVGSHVELCQKLGIPARFSFGMFDVPQSKVLISNLDDLPVVTYYTTLRTPAEEFIKRAMDIGVSAVGLLLTMPLYPWISYRIRKESPGPVIFKQRRVGENGRIFKCYKFRTMYLNAEDQKKDLLADNQMDGPIFKIENDPRVTPFGAFLRRTSLDELPQFFNILRGDMSVVGTRPPTPDEVERYETHFRRRLSIRPGLTGLWQVSGRNQIRRFEDILELDLQYIDRWSIGLDIQIILRTIWVTLFRRGAY